MEVPGPSMTMVWRDVYSHPSTAEHRKMLNCLRLVRPLIFLGQDCQLRQAVILQELRRLHIAAFHLRTWDILHALHHQVKALPYLAEDVQQILTCEAVLGEGGETIQGTMSNKVGRESLRTT